MCIPHAPNSVLPSKHKKRRGPKKHIELDKKRMKPDPDFVDERTKPYTPKKEEQSLLDEITSLFD